MRSLTFCLSSPKVYHTMTGLSCPSWGQTGGRAVFFLAVRPRVTTGADILRPKRTSAPIPRRRPAAFIRYHSSAGAPRRKNLHFSGAPGLANGPRFDYNVRNFKSKLLLPGGKAGSNSCHVFRLPLLCGGEQNIALIPLAIDGSCKSWNYIIAKGITSETIAAGPAAGEA